MMSYKNKRNILLGFMVLVAIMIVTGIFLFSKINYDNILEISYVRDMAIDNMGMLIGDILLIGIFAGKNYDKHNTAMFRMIFSLSALFFFDILTSFMEGKSRYVVGIIIVNTIAIIFEDLLAYTYWTYIRAELQLKDKFVKYADKTALIVTIVSIIFSIVNIRLGIFYTVTEAGEYVDSPYEFLADIAIIIIFVLALFAIIVKSDKRINEKLVLMSFEIFPFAAYMMGSITQAYEWVYPANLMSVLLIYIRIFSNREKKIAEQQVLLTQQSTALTISQIQPHFLYNVLTTISNLCATDPEEAEETTVLFAQYLRTNLDSLRNQEPVPFSTELMHIKTYVELEKKRFGDILNVEYDIQEQNFMVPSLGLQPIVENSIKHGIRGKNAPGHIIIRTYKEADKYKIVIEDDGVGFDMNQPPKEDGRSHVGMQNVKERLKQMCNATMKIESSPGNGCRTEITL